MEKVASTDCTDVQRPFKMILSLLDKWEIGSALSVKLALPALRTIRKTATDRSTMLSDEVGSCHLLGQY